METPGIRSRCQTSSSCARGPRCRKAMETQRRFERVTLGKEGARGAKTPKGNGDSVIGRAGRQPIGGSGTRLKPKGNGDFSTTSQSYFMLSSAPGGRDAERQWRRRQPTTVF